MGGEEESSAQLLYTYNMHQMGRGTVVLHFCKTQGSKTYSMWNIPSVRGLC